MCVYLQYLKTSGYWLTNFRMGWQNMLLKNMYIYFLHIFLLLSFCLEIYFFITFVIYILLSSKCEKLHILYKFNIFNFKPASGVLILVSFVYFICFVDRNLMFTELSAQTEIYKQDLMCQSSDSSPTLLHPIAVFILFWQANGFWCAPYRNP